MTLARRVLKRAFNLLGYEIKRYQPEPKTANSASTRPAPHPTIRVNQFGWGRANQLFDFITRELYTHYDLDADNYGVTRDVVEKQKWGLKGFGYSLVVNTVAQLPAQSARPLRLLDVGGGGSALPRVLHEQFGAEGWLVDDFGIESGDEPTSKWYAPDLRQTLLSKNPMVHYAFGRLGAGPVPGLEPGSFDVVYSISTLEHIPPAALAGVFDHMLELLSPNGVMIHTIDMVSGEFRRWQHFLTSYFEPRGVPATTFMIKNLNEVGDDDPPLLESAENIFSFWNMQPKRYYRQGTLVLEAQRIGSNSASSP